MTQRLTQFLGRVLKLGKRVDFSGAERPKNQLLNQTPEVEVFVLPMSFAQQRLWFLQQLMPENSAYNVPLAVRLAGELNIAALEQTFNEMVRRHESLRTHFRMVNGQPMQAIAPHLTVPLALIDLQTFTDPQREVQRLTLETFQQPFDLTQTPLLRVKLLQLGKTDFVLLLTMHHIVADGWSIAVLVRELGALYTAFAAGQPSPLAELPIQYADFAHWQREWLQGELTQQLAYWQQQLNGAAPGLELPGYRPRISPTFKGARETLLLSQDLKQAIACLSERSGATLFMTLLAAFQTLLYRYTGEEDIVVGSPIANRNQSEIEGLIGFFVNSLVLRTDLSGNPTFQELLERVRLVALDAYAHQDLPFEKLVEALQPERDLNRNPLFQVVFALQNAPLERLELPGLTLSPLPIDPGTARFDLEFQLVECLETLAVIAIYRTDLFEQAAIARMLGHFQTLLEGIVTDPDQPISNLPLLTVSEQQQLVTWNNTQADYPQDWCIHHWFEAQVKRTPEAIAAVFAEQQLTYQELNDRSNQLAHHLQKLGVAPEILVGVCLERSLEMLIAVLGVLKAGGAYVPLDPTYPIERLSFMVEDAQVSVLLTQQHLVQLVQQLSDIASNVAQCVCLDQAGTFSAPAPLLPEGASVYTQVPGLRLRLSSPLNPPILGDLGGECRDFDDVQEMYIHGSPKEEKELGFEPIFRRSSEPCRTPEASTLSSGETLKPKGFDLSSAEGDEDGSECRVNVTAENLAYVIYTSGSTGKPKGVLVPHRGLSNLAQAQIQVFNVQSGDRILQFASLSFDASIFEIIMALSVGASLHLAKPESLLGADLIRLLQDNRITHATLPPALLRALPAHHLPDLKTVIAAGEACSPDLGDRWAINRRCFNAYGLTETSVWATIAPLQAGDISIGRAIANIQLYVLDAHLQPVPIGIPGELYIGGEGLARGYLNRPELTAERFIPNPFSESGRLYRTGDRVCYRSNGTLEFLGRVDDQVKIRGYRIELGEIEAALKQHPAVQDAVMVTSENASFEKQLVAVIVLHSGKTQNPSELRRFLRQKLPEYMIPSAFVVQPSLPLLPNGKIDRANVAERYRQAVVSVAPALIAPRSPTETALAKLWAQHLDLETVDVTHNFFDLGGDSLIAMRLMEQIDRQFERSLPLSTLFLAPTVEQLAALIQNTASTPIAAESPLVALQPTGTKPPFFCVHPIFGTVFPYSPLARQLDRDRPFYGLQHLSLKGSPPDNSIEEMATHYIQAIRQVQPQSPYYIGGWSFGGVVAFEIAQQLRRAGHQIALLAILDTPAPHANSRPSWGESLHLLTTVGRSLLPLLLDYGCLVTASISRLRNTLTAPLRKHFFSDGFKPTLPQLQLGLNRQDEPLFLQGKGSQLLQSQLLNELALHALFKVYQANSQAFLNYVPQIYPDTITLFKTHRSLLKASEDLTLGWGDLTSNEVNVCPISGDHLTMLREPHVQSLSKQLRRAMEAE